MIETILTEFDDKQLLYADFTKKLSTLIEEILHDNNINAHSVTYRVKDRASLAKKLSKEDGKYKALDNITDISGIRITTYLEDDVKKIAELLTKEFQIDKKNSVDKSSLLDPDRFGYLSMHHVVSFNDARCALVEYKRFPGLKAEIQTRSILQHAWAEIEHDLGYKSSIEVPYEIRRRFSRLASLLELADQEFISIKNALNNYEKNISEKIVKNSEEVELNKASLDSFKKNSELIADLDQLVCHALNSFIENEWDDTARQLERLRFCNIHTIHDLEKALQDRADLIVKFAGYWANESKLTMKRKVSPGICLFYLCYILLAEKADDRFILNYTKLIYARPDGAIKDKIERVYKKCIAENNLC